MGLTCTIAGPGSAHAALLNGEAERSFTGGGAIGGEDDGGVVEVGGHGEDAFLRRGGGVPPASIDQVALGRALRRAHGDLGPSAGTRHSIRRRQSRRTRSPSRGTIAQTSELRLESTGERRTGWGSPCTT